MTASDVLLYRTLASALGEGMAGLLATRIDNTVAYLYAHVATAEDSKRWQEWLTRHQGDEEWATEHDVNGPHRFHYARGGWCGWRIELVYLTPVGLEAGDLA